VESLYGPVANDIVGLALSGNHDEAIVKMDNECRPLLAALVKAVRSTAGSVSKFLLVATTSIRALPLAVRTELEKAATTRIFFTVVDTETMDLVRTTVFPRPFWLPRRAYPRDLRANGRYADAIVEIEIGKNKESHFMRLPAVRKLAAASAAAAHMERFSK